MTEKSDELFELTLIVAEVSLKQMKEEWDEFLSDCENGIDYEDEFLSEEIMVWLGKIRLIKKSFPELIDTDADKIMGNLEFISDRFIEKNQKKIRKAVTKSFALANSR